MLPIALALSGCAGIADALGQPQQAARLLGATQAHLDSIGLSLETADRPEWDNTLVSVRAHLGEEAFTAAWMEGNSLSLDDAIQEALNLQPPPTISPAPTISIPEPSTTELKTTDPADLTTREVEVLRLMTTGLNNIQIAEKLVLSRRAVEKHLSSIYSKLDITSRTAAVRFAIEHGLVDKS